MLGQAAFRRYLLALILSLACLVAPGPGWSASTEPTFSKSHTVYVPAYSNVFSGPRRLPFQLAMTLSIRNTDLSASLRVTSVEYFDTDGKLIRRYLQKPLLLGPLASSYFHVEEKDVSGGFGAKFLVRWDADRLINAPIIECVMIGAVSGQGISFVSPGKEIRETK